eukprot:EG_transcript_7618
MRRGAVWAMAALAVGGVPLLGFLLPPDRTADVGPPPAYEAVLFWYGVWMAALLGLAGLAIVLLDLRRRVAAQELMLRQLRLEAMGQAETRDPPDGGAPPLDPTPPWLQPAALFLGFLSANYNVFVVNFLKPLWGQFATLAPAVAPLVSTALIVGIILGEVALGHLGDQHLGLHRAFLVTTAIVVVGAAVTGLTYSFWAIAYFRFLTGVGVGGSYPICASLAAAAKEGRPQTRQDHCRTLAVFASQGVAFVLANTVALVAVALLPDSPQATWRICSGAGAVLAMAALTVFLQIPQGAALAPAEAQDTGKVVRQHWRALLGTGGSWFLFDVQFYANSLFASRILQLVFGDSGSVLDLLGQNLLVTTIPLLGFVFSGLYFRFTSWSIKTLQVVGFLGMTATYFTLGAWLDAVQRSGALFLGLYALSFVFANAGPNATTFVLPTMVYSDTVRATCHGLSAAAGKLGAVLGAAAMDPLLSAYGLRVVLYICGSIGVLGALVTVCFVPSPTEPGQPQYARVGGDPGGDPAGEPAPTP